MTDLFRDTALGQLVRRVTQNRWLRYPEEKDPNLWTQYIQDTQKNRSFGCLSDRLPSQDNEESASAEKKDAKREETGSDFESAATTTDQRHSDFVQIIGWRENDPEKPLNWSSGKRAFVIIEIMILTFSIYLGSAIYSAGLEDVQHVFGVSQVVALLGLCLFVLGYGIGPMFWSPITDIPQIGRNNIYIYTLLAFVLLQLPTGFAVDIGMLLVFRFITGFVGSPALATGGASIADMYGPKKRAYPIFLWGIACTCGPTMGPLIGGWAAMFKGWTWTIWELTWLSGVAWIFLFAFLPETSADNILYRRAQRIRSITGRDDIRSEAELENAHKSHVRAIGSMLRHSIGLNFTEPMVFLLNLYIALIYGLQYIWFESFPIVFVDVYGFNLGEEGTAFIGILIGSLVIIPPFFYWLYKVQEPKFNENGEIKPEERLPPAFVGAFAIVICLFWFGWSTGRTPWIMPIIGSGWFTVGSLLLFNAVLNYLGDAYPRYAGSVLAGNALFRASFGAGFPLFATAMYRKLGVQWASSVLGFLAVLFVPIPFVLYRYGAVLRLKYSRHARKDFQN